MDNTELHYLTYDADTILENMMEAYIEAGGSVVRAGDEKEMLMRSVMAVMVQAFAGIDNALRMDSLRYAIGEYLDVYGEKRNCYRMQATKAKAEIRVTLANTGEATTIPAGSAVTQDGETIYVTDTDITVTGAGQVVDVDVTAESAGSAGNSLLNGAVMEFVSAWDCVTNVICITAASGGQDMEEDEDYRERIRLYGLATVTTGPAEMYERIAMETSSEIIDAKAINGGDLEVDVYLIISEDATSADIISAVTGALSPDDARPLSDDVVVAAAEDVTYTLAVQYKGPDNIDLADGVAEAVATYKVWQDNKIGRAFNPDVLKAYLYNAGCTLVTFGSGSNFDGGTVEYTEIDENQRCKGTITTAVINT